MTWVGNDIIDLTLAEKALARQERYLEKAFCPSERDLIQSSRQPSRMLWLLWSMKESAYKVHVRKTLERKLNPIRFVCELLGEERGRVSIDSATYDTNSRVKEEFIHTIATPSHSNPGKLESVVLKGTGHKQIRQHLIEKVSRSYSEENEMQFEGVEFQKDLNGFPGVRLRGLEEKIHPCSISHHGKFGAYAIAFGEASP